MTQIAFIQNGENELSTSEYFKTSLCMTEHTGLWNLLQKETKSMSLSSSFRKKVAAHFSAWNLL